MIKKLIHLIISFSAFGICFLLASLTDSELNSEAFSLKEVVVYIFSIQWIVFIPAYLLKSEKFYDLTGSCTYVFAVIFVLYNSTQNIANLILGGNFISWTCVLLTDANGSVAIHCEFRPGPVARHCVCIDDCQNIVLVSVVCKLGHALADIRRPHAICLGKTAGLSVFTQNIVRVGEVLMYLFERVLERFTFQVRHEFVFSDFFEHVKTTHSGLLNSRHRNSVEFGFERRHLG